MAPNNLYPNGSVDPSIPLRFARNGSSFTHRQLLDGSFEAARQTIFVLSELGLSVQQAHKLLTDFIRPVTDVDDWKQLTILVAECHYLRYVEQVEQSLSTEQNSGDTVSEDTFLPHDPLHQADSPFPAAQLHTRARRSGYRALEFLAFMGVGVENAKEMLKIPKDVAVRFSTHEQVALWAGRTLSTGYPLQNNPDSDSTEVELDVLTEGANDDTY